MCICGAIQRQRCICDQTGWTIVVRPEGVPYTSSKAQWYGWTQFYGAHNQWLTGFKRQPSGVVRESCQVTFLEWCIHQGSRWRDRQGRPIKGLTKPPSDVFTTPQAVA